MKFPVKLSEKYKNTLEIPSDEETVVLIDTVFFSVGNSNSLELVEKTVLLIIGEILFTSNRYNYIKNQIEVQEKSFLITNWYFKNCLQKIIKKMIMQDLFLEFNIDQNTF